MQIQLKQVEIIEALKAHITKQGFSLIGKTVEISFTAGRKDAGLSADITIEEVAIPGADIGDVEEAAKPVLSVVKGAVMALATPETEKAAVAPVAVAADASTESDKQPTSSLFG